MRRLKRSAADLVVCISVRIPRRPGSIRRPNEVNWHPERSRRKSSPPNSSPIFLIAWVSDGCEIKQNCAVCVWYCKGEGPLPVWPGITRAVIKFLKTVR